MIVTEPLSRRRLGADRLVRAGELLDDEAHVYVYLQRTADGRIAIGGRGVPYRYGSRTDGDGRTARARSDALREKLSAMFPPPAEVAIAAPGRGLGVARDWCVSVGGRPRRAASPGPADTSAKGSRRRTSPGARCATS